MKRLHHGCGESLHVQWYSWQNRGTSQAEHADTPQADKDPASVPVASEERGKQTS